MYDSELKATRCIMEYCAQSEELLAEYPLKSFELTKFQAEFDEPNPEDPMCDCYPIHAKNLDFLQPYLQEQPSWDFEKKVYFLEAYL